MRDATGATQSVLVLGGNSDLAAAVVDRLLAERTRRVVLAARDIGAAEVRAAAWRNPPAASPVPELDVSVVAYDALDAASHRRVVDAAFTAGDIDVVLVAFGVLGEPFALGADPGDTAALGTVNFSAAVAACQAAADALERQGHGSLVVFSSVAGARVRAENAVYGASKAGLDGFALALADRLHGTGVHVMIVRPGFVHTKMTEGRPPAPMSTTAAAVADDVLRGLHKRRRVVWSPARLRLVFTALRLLPAPLWRRISG